MFLSLCVILFTRGVLPTPSPCRQTGGVGKTPLDADPPPPMQNPPFPAGYINKRKVRILLNLSEATPLTLSLGVDKPTLSESQCETLSLIFVSAQCEH